MKLLNSLLISLIVLLTTSTVVFAESDYFHQQNFLSNRFIKQHNLTVADGWVYVKIDGFYFKLSDYHNCQQCQRVIFGSSRLPAMSVYDAFDPEKGVQGFLTSEGVFVNREEAYLIAEQNNQIIKIVTDKNDRRLFSENLW